MTVIGELSEFVSGTSFSMLPDGTRENVKMHLLDTIGAMLVGSFTQDGQAIGKLLNELDGGDIPVAGYSRKAALLPAIMAECVASRTTEVDDIHLESCTTPGSIIVPTTLSLACAGYISDPKEFLVATAVGFDVVIRLGMAINGPRILYKGIWPTLFGASAGSAAATARALHLNTQETINAISIALVMTVGTSIRSNGSPSSRGLTLGLAAQNGVNAALSARAGFVGNSSLLEGAPVKLNGVSIFPGYLTRDLVKDFLIDKTSIKPYPIARQALSSVEAFRELIVTNEINPESIDEVLVFVPGYFVPMIDRPELPQGFPAITSVKYHIGLAAFSPDSLFNMTHDPVRLDQRMKSLIEKVNVKSSSVLTKEFPSVWASRVEIKAAGKKYLCKMSFPKGDYRNRFNWDELSGKFQKTAGYTLDEKNTLGIIDCIKKLDNAGNLKELIKLLG